MKFFSIFYIIFFSIFVNANSFEDLLYEWTDHMDYQRFDEADKAYIKLKKFCEDSMDKKLLLIAKSQQYYMIITEERIQQMMMN